MGGSAIGGDLAAAALGERLSGPLLTVRGYELPSWLTPEWTVLCSSYSGETEETLACFAAAGDLGARRIVASTGGELVADAREGDLPVIGLPGILPAPRTAVAYMLVTAAEVAALAGVAPSAARRDRGRRRLPLRAIRGPARARRRGRRLDRRRAAGRLRRRPHRPGGAALEDPGQRERRAARLLRRAARGRSQRDLRLGAERRLRRRVLLEDADQHPRERRRFKLTGEAIADAGAEVVWIETEGETRIARLLWATMLGDLVSLELAEARGVDPLPVEAIDDFKSALGLRLGGRSSLRPLLPGSPAGPLAPYPLPA